MNIAILSTAYFGPVQWYQKLNRYGKVLIEHHDSFIKQTYRNRCVIATANGLQALTVPVLREVSDKRISDHGNWRHQHWNALVSAYGDSPFFDYYADDIRPFFEERWEFLHDYNMAITMKICELLDIHPTIATTDSYADASSIGADDFRDAIRPKHPLPDDDFKPQRYYQVYQQRHVFQPNLSILDLLFNMGNESIFYL